jgi:serine/threonine-protein kinase
MREPLSDPEALATAAARTLTAAEALAFGATVGVRHATERLGARGADTSRGQTSAAEVATAPGAGPRTVDARSLPVLALAEAGVDGGAGAGDLDDEAVGSDRAAADFVVGRLLGEGGMGIVQLARQRSLQRDVALKRLREDEPGGASAGHVEALLREATYTGYLEHPNIVPVHALGRDERGRPLLVMKRIEGTTLARLLRAPEHEAWKRAAGDRLGLLVGALRSVCDALAYAHARGVLHRDVKPENVMLGSFGEIYLLDWGVAVRRDARLGDEAIVGTPAYMAPEMLRPGTDPLDERTDVYLVGATLHECLVGSPPHLGRTMHEVLLSAARSLPRSYPASVPAELAEIARRAMHADRAQRYASAAELGHALAELERHRAAAELARIAEARLAELEQALADGAGPDAVEPLFHECRFGFEQSLRAWPENARARDERQRAIARMCDFQLAHANRAGAAALLATLEPPPSALVEGLAALDRELAAHAEERARLERLEHDLDVSVAEHERRTAVRLLAGLLYFFAAVLLGGYALHLFRPGPRMMLVTSTPATVIIGAIAWRFRRLLFRNRVSRQMGLTIVATVVLVLTNRALGYAYARRFGDITSGDALLIALVSAISALTLRRVYAVPAVLFLVAAILCPWLDGIAFVPLIGAGVISIAAVIRAPAGLRRPLLDDAASSQRPSR